ncbi:hypothetical protein BaRGS_00014377 [Batillaria attramentaria]|uniref:Uncharacterized protein n=1 Tax=Batillaria attramentaria TaxID=370345 RepID=A0ABD0L5Q1_9CAEN
MLGSTTVDPFPTASRRLRLIKDRCCFFRFVGRKTVTKSMRVVEWASSLLISDAGERQRALRDVLALLGRGGNRGMNSNKSYFVIFIRPGLTRSSFSML